MRKEEVEKVNLLSCGFEPGRRSVRAFVDISKVRCWRPLYYCAKVKRSPTANLRNVNTGQRLLGQGLRLEPQPLKTAPKL